jgi:hypothetical protein
VLLEKMPGNGYTTMAKTKDLGLLIHTILALCVNFRIASEAKDMANKLPNCQIFELGQTHCLTSPVADVALSAILLSSPLKGISMSFNIQANQLIEINGKLTNDVHIRLLPLVALLLNSYENTRVRELDSTIELYHI